MLASDCGCSTSPSVTIYSNTFQSAPGTATAAIYGVWNAVGQSRSLAPAKSGEYTSMPSQSTATLDLTGLASHAALVISFDLIVIGDKGTYPSWTGGPSMAITADGVTLKDSEFSNLYAAQVYPGDTGDAASHCRHEGAVEVNKFGYDQSGNAYSSCCATQYPADSLYHFSFTVDHSSSSLDLAFTPTTSGGAKYALDNVSVSTVAAAGNDVTSEGEGTVYASTPSLPASGQGGLGGAGPGVGDKGAIADGGKSAGLGMGTTSPVPQLMQLYGSTTLLSVVGNSSDWFDLSGSDYVERYGGHDTLYHDAAAHEFALTRADGSQTRFNDFDASLNASNRGRVKQVRDAEGNYTSYDFNFEGKLVDATGSTGEKVTYDYPSWSTPDDPHATHVTTATLYHGTNVVRSLDYAYYAAGDVDGGAADLKLVTERDRSGAATGTSYYRYYTADLADHGYAGAVKMTFGPEAYARLTAVYGTNVASLSDAQVDDYADAEYTYYSSSNGATFDHRVKSVTRAGDGASADNGGDGRGTTSYVYRDSTNTAGFNVWSHVADITGPDGTQRHVYTDYAGQPIWEVTEDTAGHLRGTYYRYETNHGRLVLEAHPSATSLPTNVAALELGGGAGLMAVSGTNQLYLRDDRGLIEVTTYPTSTTATSSTNAATTGGGYAAGDVLDHVKSRGVQRGETGPAITVESWTYWGHTYQPSTNAAAVTTFQTATDTTYPNPSTNGARVTHYDYAFRSDGASKYGHSIESETTTLPTIAYTQNGNGQTNVSSIEFYDTFGRTQWTRDPTGSIGYTAYDAASGAVTEQIADVDTSQTSYFTGLPSGWANTNGANLITTTAVDRQGRPTKVTDPAGHVTYTVYNDAAHEVRTYRGFDGTNVTGPIAISRTYYPAAGASAGQQTVYSESLAVNVAPALSSGVPTGAETFTASNVASLSRSLTSDAGQSTESDRYFDLSGQTYSQAAAHIGSAGTNYYAGQTGYDLAGRSNRVVNALGTITRTAYDDLGRSVSTWVGTDDTPSSGYWSPTNTTGTDLTKVSETLYDTYDPATVMIGDGNVTRVTTFPSGTNAARVSETYYDWRDRAIASKSGLLLDGGGLADAAGETNSASVQRLASYSTYDNLGEVTQGDTYDADGYAFVTGSGTNQAIVDGNNDGVPDAPGTNALRARMTTDYDDQGRTWQSQQFLVNQSTGAVSANSLKGWQWYDKRGMTLKTLAPGGLASKYVYDGAGRVIKQYTTDGAGDAEPGTSGTWDSAGTVVGDHVHEQVETTYDGNGNALLLTTRRHFHSDANTGELGNATGTPRARVTYQAFYYDNADRMTDSIDIGTNGGSAYTRPGSAPTNRSNTLLISHTDYDDANRIVTTTDPRGIVAKTYFDLLGRTTQTIANYVDGAPSAADDQTTQWTYDGNDDVLTMKAVLPMSGTNAVFQTTQYVYGVTAAGGNGLTSNDLLKEVRYPDKTTGAASTNAANIEAFTYDALGERKTLADRNGSVHTYSYDALGRLTTDNVTTLGSGVDGTVRRLEYTYDTAGRPYTFTSYSGSTGGSVLNQTLDEYNGYGQLTAEYQAHGGTVVANVTPAVRYAYSEGGNNAGAHNNHSRLTAITYPDGRVLRYEYGAVDGVDDKVSRLQFLADQADGAASTHIEEYQYLGLSTVVIRNRPGGNSKLTYDSGNDSITGDAGDRYTGLDRFDRVVDQNWTGQSGSSATTLDRFGYGYDADGNPLYKQNLNGGTTAASFSELYQANGTNGTGYDGLNRLTDFRRGTLSDVNSDGAYDTVTTPNTLAGSVKNWALDAVGNQTSTTTGTNSAEVRTHNSQNELTAVGGNSLTFDNAGNTTTDETGKTFSYDAWNRMTGAMSGTNAVQAYAYDATGRRISENPGTAKDLYYSSQWQVLEERVGGVATSQFVWSPTYVDELIERDRDASATADGTLDTSFDSDGKTSVDFGSTDTPRAVAVQADGKILVAGNNSDILIVRYNPDGTLDTTFDGDGKVVTHVASIAQVVNAIVVQPDGKIVVAGRYGSHAMVARYNADGSPDASFDGDGQALTNLGGGALDEARGLALQADGRIVIAGYKLTSGVGYDWVVARYSADGSLDTSFDTDGKLATDMGGSTEQASSVLIQADGQIVVTGFSNGDFALARYNAADGSLDTSFDADGKVTTDLGGTEAVNAVALQRDGKILVGGSTAGNFAVARYLPDGTLDTTFDADGYLTTDFGGFDAIFSVVPGADLKIVAAGNTTNGFDFAVARYVVASGLEERLYAQTDANHNVTSIADAFGSVRERFAYDPYGEQTILNPTTYATQGDAYGFLYGHQGGRYDEATGLIHFRHRDLSPTLGRWTQADMAGYVDGSNLYQHALSNPVALSDPTGFAASTQPTTQPLNLKWTRLELRPTVDGVKGMPWFKTELPIVAGTSADESSVKVDYNEKTNCLSAVVTMTQKIVLNVDQYRANKDLFKLDAETVYGHEQAHVLTNIASAQSVARDLENTLEQINQLNHSSQTMQMLGSEAMNHAEEELTRLIHLNVAHELYPKEHEKVNPVGGIGPGTPR